MKILSLFDGISCGRVALERAEIPVEEYHAFEVDPYAIQISEKNYPDIVHHGDVFKGNFEDFSGFDMLIGGSPCTYWSIAQSPNKRETQASGIGWELFSQYVRALREMKPEYFVYENNYSMADAIRESITETFGFEPVMIDSALLSGQSRKRLYWVGKKNQDGEYERICVPEPKDKGILLKDILESGKVWQEKSYCLTANYHPTFQSNLEMHRNTMAAEPVAGMILPLEDAEEIPLNPVKGGKAHTICATYGNIGESPFSPRGSECARQRIAVPVRLEHISEENSAVLPVNTLDGKSRTIKAQYANTSIANAVRHDGFGATMAAEQVEEIPLNPVKGGKSHTICATYGKIGESPFSPRGSERNKQRIAVPVRVGEIGNGGQGQRIYSVRGKSVTLSANGGGQGAKTGLYKIDLPDGDYIIRKLTPVEAERLQTLPDNYTEGISNTQRYKCIGNGWTVDVIAYLMQCAVSGKTEPLFKQLSFF